MGKKSLIKCLLEEQMEFCYTQTTNVYGISKDAIAHKFGKYIPKYIIEMCKNKHDVHIVYSYDDDVYMYVKEVK